MVNVLPISIFLMTLLVTSSRALPVKQGPAVSEGDVNTCLFACAMCFDDSKHDDLLMMCANELCLGALRKGKALNFYFGKQCPLLKVAWNGL